jgi:hypothetical protein
LPITHSPLPIIEQVKMALPLLNNWQWRMGNGQWFVIRLPLESVSRIITCAQ